MRCSVARLSWRWRYHRQGLIDRNDRRQIFEHHNSQFRCHPRLLHSPGNHGEHRLPRVLDKAIREQRVIVRQRR